MRIRIHSPGYGNKIFRYPAGRIADLFSIGCILTHCRRLKVQVVLDAELHLWRAFLDSETVTVGAMKCYHLV